MKHVARQALRVYPHQHGTGFRRYIPHLQNNRLFRFGGTHTLKTVDPKVAKAAGKVRFRDLI